MKFNTFLAELTANAFYCEEDLNEEDLFKTQLRLAKIKPSQVGWNNLNHNNIKPTKKGFKYECRTKRDEMAINNLKNKLGKHLSFIYANEVAELIVSYIKVKEIKNG